MNSLAAGGLGAQPYTVNDTDLLEAVQNRAAHWIKSFWDPSTYQWSKSSVTCVEELGWPSLKARRINFSIWTFYCILHKTTAIDFSRYFHFNTLPTRSHSLTLNLLSCTINAFRHSFFVASGTSVMELHTILHFISTSYAYF